MCPWKAIVCKVERERHGDGPPGSRSDVCGRNHVATHAARSDAGTRRRAKSEVVSCSYEPNPASESNLAILESNETAIGNRHPMRVGAEVAKVFHDYGVGLNSGADWEKARMLWLREAEQFSS